MLYNKINFTLSTPSFLSINNYSVSFLDIVSTYYYLHFMCLPLTVPIDIDVIAISQIRS